MLPLIIGLLLVIAFALHKTLFAPLPSSEPAAPPAEKVEEKARPFGVWEAVKFAYPRVSSWVGFNVDATKPIPFRPFRWGPSYPINMGIRPMGWENWIELDSDYRKTHAIRLERTTTRGELASRTLPGYRAQALECLLEICSYLSFRHPNLFVVTRATYDAAKPETHGDSLVGEKGGAVTSIHNKITDELWDFAEIERREGSDWNPMYYAGLLGQDDLAVMVEGTDGQYFFQAGSICTAGFWRLQDKIGLSLEDIHSRGVVPGWKDKLKFSMERFFQKLKVDKPVQRNNYFFQIDDQLAWSSNTNGPEEIFHQGEKGPVAELLKASEDPTWKAPAPTSNFEDIWFRTERQTLRRMPKTGCILFTIRTYFHKVADIANEKGVPGRMASAIRSWPDDVSLYKGGPLYAGVMLPKLDALHAEQLATGVVELDEEGAVVGEPKYPFISADLA